MGTLGSFFRREISWGMSSSDGESERRRLIGDSWLHIWGGVSGSDSVTENSDAEGDKSGVEEERCGVDVSGEEL